MAKSTGTVETLAAPTPEDAAEKIQIRSLYKIFGSDPTGVMPLVKQGVDKDTLLNEHKHVLALEDINLTIHDHMIYVVMGLSGSGKSTLIRHINRLIEPTDGELVVDGEDVLRFSTKQLAHFRQTKTGMVFQRFGLLPHRSILSNVGYGLEIQRKPKAEIEERARYWIGRVGLAGYEHHTPVQLSGGMQQRVGLARALATDAEILLMDEAFSALDPLIRTDMQDLLLELQGQLAKTVVFITHDLDEALKLADGMAVLKDGRIVQKGDPQDIIMRPTDPYVEDFVRDINRARVIRVRSIARPVTDAGRLTTSVGADDNLERVLAVTGSDLDAVLGVERQGQLVGEVAVREVVEVLRPMA
jgi:glycine betaine/proline transport system ATP-binding protein